MWGGSSCGLEDEVENVRQQLLLPGETTKLPGPPVFPAEGPGLWPSLGILLHTHTECVHTQSQLTLRPEATQSWIHIHIQ
jgi:hypothetical protein